VELPSKYFFAPLRATDMELERTHVEDSTVKQEGDLQHASSSKTGTPPPILYDKPDAVSEIIQRLCQRQLRVRKMRDCLGKPEASLESKESNEIEVEFVAENPEVPKQEVAVKSFAALKKQHRDRHLAVRNREKPKERTQGKEWIPKKLAAVSRGMTRRAEMARRKGYGRQEQGKDKLYQEPRKDRRSGRDVERNRKGSMEQGTETSRSSDILEARRHSVGSTERLSYWRS
jgi:hypothetical protein